MIFPKEIIENTSNYFQFKSQVKSRIIFTLVLLLLITAFGSMPFLKTDIYVTGPGIIKPDLERVGVVSPTTGFVVSNHLQSNKPIIQGDTLLILDDSSIKEEIFKIEEQRDFSQNYIADLEYLLSDQIIKREKIQLPINRTNYLKYEQRLRQFDKRLQQATMVFNRQSKLHEQGVISDADYEKIVFEKEVLEGDKQQVIKDQEFGWESERKQEMLKVVEYENSLITLKRRLHEYVLIAPLSGVLFNVKGIEKGNFINAGEFLGEVSPETKLIVETFMSPSDIGLIRKQSQVNYQIDAYNYNHWGLATGQIIEISNDLESVNDQPVFKVRSTLNETSLSLKNGFEGKLKKGLTLRARYHITERSLFDLLYDKIDDWLNPSQNNFQTITTDNNGIN